MGKQDILLYIFVVIFSSCQSPVAKSGFDVKVNISGMTDSVIYFHRPGKDSNHPLIDTVKVRQRGIAEWKGKVNSPVLAYMSTPSHPYKQVSFFLENDHYLIQGKYDSLSKTIVTGGGIAQHDYLIWKQLMTKIKPQKDSLGNDYIPFNSMLNIRKQYIKSHPASIVSAYLLSDFVCSHQAADSQLHLLHTLRPDIQKSYYGRQVAENIKWDTTGFPGHKATAFTSTTMKGKIISLSDYRGKYVLLDFWASWCVPCRESNPHLKEIWNRYKDKNFQIIGIGDDDRSPDKLKVAIAEDKVNEWPNILSGMGTKQDLIKFYSIRELPTKILIDPQGNIIFRCEVNTMKLDQKLAEVLK